MRVGVGADEGVATHVVGVPTSTHESLVSINTSVLIAAKVEFAAVLPFTRTKVLTWGRRVW